MTTVRLSRAESPQGRRPRRRSRRRHLGANICGVIIGLVWLFPAYWMVNTAFKPQFEVLTNTPLFVPLHATFANFVAAVKQSTFLDNLRSSVIVVCGAVLISVGLALFAAAALSRYRFRGRRSLMVSLLLLQMLPSTALLIPMFLIFNDVGLLGTYMGLILAYTATVLPFSIWVLRGFFLAVPFELDEAARLDGASTWSLLWRILFPLVMPGVVATSVFAFIAGWNDFIFAYTFMKNQDMYTLPVWLSSFTTPLTGTDYGGQMAGSILFSLPVVVFFVLIQRNLVKGMAGAVKG